MFLSKIALQIRQGTPEEKHAETSPPDIPLANNDPVCVQRLSLPFTLDFARWRRMRRWRTVKEEREKDKKMVEKYKEEMEKDKKKVEENKREN